MSLLVVVRNDARAEALLRWASCFTDGNFEELYVLDCRESEHETSSEWKMIEDENFPDVSYKDFLKKLDDEERMEIHYLSVKSPDAYSTVMAEQKKLKPNLLLLDRNVAEDSEFEVKYIERLLNDVFCAVMVLRLGGTDGKNAKILVPVGGGPNTKYALKMINRSAALEPTAFFVEPDVDEVSLDVGYSRLGSILSSSGVKPDAVVQKAVISGSVSSSISNEVKEGDYGMLLIGATGASTLKRKLFGSIPDKLLKGRDGTAVAVIRSERPIGHRIRESFESFLHLSIPQLNREERVLLFSDIEDKSIWSFDFAALMILATAIASLGLLANSAAVVIGAMLVAPLMTPLLGGGLALVQGNWPLWKRCQSSVMFGFMAALVVGLISGLIANIFEIHLTGELAARGNPTALDLGIAFVSGLAASYCLARPKLSGALAGVAIAAALVPPIATTGICLMIGEMDVVRGSALLFGTNVVAIVFGSALNFYFSGIRGRKGTSGVWSRRLFIIFALICVGLAVPLTSSLIGTITRNESVLQVMNDQFQNKLKVISVAREGYNSEGQLKIRVIIEAKDTPSYDSLEQINKILQKEYSSKTKILNQDSKQKDVSVRVETRLVQTIEN